MRYYLDAAVTSMTAVDGPSHVTPSSKIEDDVDTATSLTLHLQEMQRSSSSFFSPVFAHRARRSVSQHGCVSSFFRTGHLDVKLSTIGTKRHDAWVSYVDWCTKRLMCLVDTPSNVRTLTVSLIFVPIKRKFAVPLTSEHVNGGWCSKGEFVADIVIYRKEEMSKVIVHELAHALVPDAVPREAQDVRVSRGPLKTTMMTINVNECVVETIASFVHTACVASSAVAEPHKPILRRVDACLDIETRFVDRQAKRVLKIFDAGTDTVRCNALSYYVAKAAVLTDPKRLEEFLGLLKTGGYGDGKATWANFVRRSVERYVASVPVKKSSESRQLGNAGMTRWDLGQWIETHIP